MDKYGSFEENGYTVTAYMPSEEKDPLEWYVEIKQGDEIVKQENIAMMFAPLFGPDVCDVAKLEEITDKLLRELKEGK